VRAPSSANVLSALLATSGRIFAATALAAFASALAWAPLAGGAAAPVAEGRTTLQLNAGLYRQLRNDDVRLVELKGAKARGRTVTLPVDGGELDSQETSVDVAHEGGFKLIAGRRVATVRKLSLDTAAARLSGRIDGKRLEIASLIGLDTEHEGFGVEVDLNGLRLTGKAALALNRALGLHRVFKRGNSLGILSSVVQPEIVTIPNGTISMGGPGTAFSKLESLDVQMGLWGGSERWSAPGENYFLFPVEPTAVPPDASAGVIAAPANDGTTMQIYTSPPREMLLRGPRIDLASRELSATISSLSTADPVTATIATLDYGEAKVEIRPSAGSARPDRHPGDRHPVHRRPPQRTVRHQRVPGRRNAGPADRLSERPVESRDRRDAAEAQSEAPARRSTPA
jgi:hypothetical protein